MNFLVATYGRATADPRTTNLIESLRDNAMEPLVLEVQAFTPPWRDMVNCRRGWRLQKTTRNTSMSWSSRSAARQEFEECLRSKADSIPALRGLLRAKQLNATSAYLYNRLAIAFHGLNQCLQSDPIQPVRLIIAEDFETALASLLLESQYQHVTCYDAHELHSVAIRLFGDCTDEAFIDALEDAEHYVWRHVALLVTVSPGLSEIMTTYRQRHDVLSVPNFVPRSRSRFSTNQSRRPLRCIYAGGAAPFRNVQSLIDVWPRHEEAPTLDLFIPPSQWRDQAVVSAESNLNVRVHDPVPTDELVTLMSQFDVGILPYAYPHPYAFASPNKFGEYLAAGLPVIAHPQAFTQSLIHEFQIGICEDLTSINGVASALRRAQPEFVSTCKQNVRSAFETSLNWDRVFQAWLNRLLVLDGSLDLPSAVYPTVRPSPGPNRRLLLNSMFDLVLDHLRPALIRMEKSLRRLRLVSWLPKSLVQRLS